MFIYRIGLAPSLASAINWVKSGFITINQRISKDPKKLIKLHDFVSFNDKV